MSKHKAFNKKSNKKKDRPFRDLNLTPEQQKHVLNTISGFFMGQLITDAIKTGKEITIQFGDKEAPSPTPPDDDPDPILD